MISICIPLYNKEKYLERCINSILSQTYKDFEVIIVDDCSTDNSLKMIPTDDKRFKVFKNEKNLGCGLNRRKTIELASGEWFAFIDADDYVDHDYLETLINKSNGVDMVIENCEVENILTGEQLYSIIYNNWLNFTCWGKLIHKDIVRSIPYCHLKFCEDVYTNCHWYFNSKLIKCIPGNRYHYERNNDSLSKNSTIDHYLCNIIAAYENIKLCLKHNLNKQANELIDKLFVIHSYIKKQYPLYNDINYNAIINNCIIIKKTIEQQQ